MANYDPTNAIVSGTEGDLNALISTLKDDLPTLGGYVTQDNTGSPISTTSGTPVIITGASITVSLSASQDENVIIYGDLQFSGSTGAETVALDIFNGSSALKTVRAQVQTASTFGNNEFLSIYHKIPGGLSGSYTFSLRWHRGGSTVYSAGHTFSVDVVKRRS